MHTVNSDTSPEYVFIKILNLLKLHFERRDNLIEKELAEPLKPNSVKFYEKSYTYKHSKFGTNCPINLANPIKNK